MGNILFYTTKPPYGAFSNFSKHSVSYQGFIGPTSEHLFQAMKFYPDNIDLVELVLSQPTPKLSAVMGRDKSLPLRKDWDSVVNVLPDDLFGTCIQYTKDYIMYEIIKDKFTRYSALSELLLSTGDDNIVEDSPVDSYWGIGNNNMGQNKLGKILMLVRDGVLKKE